MNVNQLIAEVGSIKPNGNKWNLKYAVSIYGVVKELENYVLWRAHKDLVQGEIEQFYKEVGISARNALRKIGYFESQILLSNKALAPDILSESEAVDIIEDESHPMNGISVGTWNELKGSSPDEKLEFYNQAKEEIGKEPSRDNLREYKKSLSDTVDRANISTIDDAISIASEEFGEDYFELSGSTTESSINLFTLGTELMKYKPVWKKIRNELAKVAHSDKGGDDEVMAFINFLNDVFKDQVKADKKRDTLDKMHNRIKELTNHMG